MKVERSKVEREMTVMVAVMVVVIVMVVVMIMTTIMTTAMASYFLCKLFSAHGKLRLELGDLRRRTPGTLYL